jgi:hypothetical protein
VRGTPSLSMISSVGVKSEMAQNPSGSMEHSANAFPGGPAADLFNAALIRLRLTRWTGPNRTTVARSPHDRGGFARAPCPRSGLRCR